MHVQGINMESSWPEAKQGQDDSMLFGAEPKKTIDAFFSEVTACLQDSVSSSWQFASPPV